MTSKFMSISGGSKLEAKLKEIAQMVSSSAVLNVGFLSGSTERKNELPSAYVAVLNEYGGTAIIPAHDQSIFRQIDSEGEFKNGGQFVKKKKANFETVVHVEEYTVTRKPRPFFRRMIYFGKDHWGDDLAEALKENDYDAAKSLNVLGMLMQGELQESILANVYAPLAKSTKARKGNDQQLVESGDMLNAVDYEVV